MPGPVLALLLPQGHLLLQLLWRNYLLPASALVHYYVALCCAVLLLLLAVSLLLL